MRPPGDALSSFCLLFLVVISAESRKAEMCCDEDGELQDKECNDQTNWAIVNKKSFWLSLLLPSFGSFHLLSSALVVPSDSSLGLPSCRPDQRDYLLGIKNSISILPPPPALSFIGLLCSNTSYPKTLSWRENEDCCSWDGITCNIHSGVVIGLDLSCSRLLGTIDSNSSLFSLRHLRTLSLAGNYLELQGPTMSSLVRNLTALEEIDLTYVNMSTVIPTSLANFTSHLTYLKLVNCWLRGELPYNIFQFPNLYTLDLSDNGLLSVILPQSNWSSGLISLSLSGVSFTGEIPRSIGNLSQLTLLDLSWTSFTGYINIRTFSTLENLRYLELSGTSVSGDYAMDEQHNFPKLEGLNIWLGTLINFPCFMSSMPQLKTLELYDSIITGVSSKCESTNLVFPRLEKLNMAHCNFTKFPFFLSRSEGLITLDLTGNMFKEIPDWFWGIGIDTLEDLDLESNLAEGDIRLLWRKLRYLNLHNNSFEGPLPVPSQSIQTFYASQNRFNGSIPPQICKLASLLRISLAQNNLTGIIPQCLGNITGLEFVNLSNNSLMGPLPRSNCTSLQILDVSYNNIIDTPPVWLAAASLRELHLQSNDFEGTWPTDFFLEKSLTTLDLSSNKFEGPPPCPSDTTVNYVISSNNFSGEIGSCLCKAGRLYILDMSNNGLTGNLPECLKNITFSLVYLGLQNNEFRGAIPEICSNGSSLRALDFSWNQFEGPLSTSILNCQNLEVLDVGHNMISDSFPDWLLDHPLLKVLSLRSNKFHGSVSVSKGARSSSELRILDLSENSLEGNLPDDLIVKMVGMMRTDDDLQNDTTYMGSGWQKRYLNFSFGESVVGDDSYQQFYSVVINLKGVEREMLKINVELATLDLSSNHFHGELPRNIGLLSSLRGLNLAHNNLTGTIPTSLGNLTNLESLDLSSNLLVGEIPKELAWLSFLGFLNLSRNNLTGQIPTGGHLNTFPNSSFEGNPGLCGLPLTRGCGPPLRSPMEPRDDGEDDTGSWLEWKFVVMGFGSGMGIGISIGYIVLEMGRPLWLARMVLRLEAKFRNKPMRRRNRRRS